MWFDEIEKYYNDRNKNLVNTFWGRTDMNSSTFQTNMICLVRIRYYIHKQIDLRFIYPSYLVDQKILQN